MGPAAQFVGADDALLDRHWDAVVETAATSLIARDRITTKHKSYIRPWAKLLNLDLLIRKHRTRSLLSRLVPSIRGREWQLPPWLADPDTLAAATPIFKINNAPGWAVWAMAHRPETRVLHLVRHPGGMLNSWLKRYAVDSDPTDLLSVTRRRLHRLVQAEPRWAEQLGDIEAMSAEEAELWYWRYHNEAIHTAGNEHDRYIVVPSERLASDPLKWARQAFEFCGLAWSDSVEQQVMAMSTTSHAIAHAWQKSLTRQQIEVVERVLAGSSLAKLWDNVQPTFPPRENPFPKPSAGTGDGTRESSGGG